MTQTAPQPPRPRSLESGLGETLAELRERAQSLADHLARSGVEAALPGIRASAERPGFAADEAPAVPAAALAALEAREAREAITARHRPEAAAAAVSETTPQSSRTASAGPRGRPSPQRPGALPAAAVGRRRRSA